MNTLQSISRNASHTPARRTFTAIAATALVLALSALPAAARQDPGQIDPPSRASSTHSCSVERVGTQYVACDNLTGNGVPAPGWVHER